jgi:hypothetical protein
LPTKELRSEVNIKQKRSTIVGGLVVVAVLVASIAYSQHARSPEQKKDEAITALETRDAALLIRLADPVEVATLKLTSTNVRELLNHTLWREPLARHSTIIKGTRVPNDQSIWEAHFNGTQSGITRVIVPIIDTPRLGWKLNLSMMLRSSCFWAVGNQEGPALFRRLAKEVGIGGLRQQNGEYASLEVLEERTAEIARLRGQK